MKNSCYTLERISKEPNPLFQSNPSLGEWIYVAVIKDSEQEQPFRVVVENFDDLAEAEAQIRNWIRCREEEDARLGTEAERAEAESKADENISKLQETFSK